MGVEKQYLDDWLKVRKSKKGINTRTAFEGILRKIKLSGLTTNECIKIAAERGWNGFDPKWLNDFTITTINQPTRKPNIVTKTGYDDFKFD